MASNSKVKVGYMKCETRGCVNGNGGPGRVVVKQNKAGTLSYRCEECDSAPYVREGSGQHAAWVRDMEKSPAPAPAAKEPPAPEKKEPPAPPKPDAKPAAAARVEW